MEDEHGERHRLLPGDYTRFFSTLAAAGQRDVAQRRSRTASGSSTVTRSSGRSSTPIPTRVYATAVEEIVRYASPVMHMRRNVAHDTELAGQALAAGDRVVIWYRSANHDDAAFDDPERFDVTRSPNDHLGYGAGGPHFCLGAHLARLEIRIALEELYARFPRSDGGGRARAGGDAPDQRHQATGRVRPNRVTGRDAQGEPSSREHPVGRGRRDLRLPFLPRDETGRAR